MATVTSQLTRIHDLEGTLTVVSVGGGAGAAANTDIFIQGSQSLGRRQSNVTLNGFMIDDGGSNNLSAAGTHLGVWFWCTHFSSLTAVRVRIADNSGSANYDEHIIPLTEVPATGGWIRLWIHVNRTPDATGGTALTESTARYFGPIISIPTVGGNAANLIMDAVDSTTSGLLLTGTSGLWSDYSTADEGSSTNKYGVVQTIGGVIYCKARLTLGSSSSLVFTDSNFSIVFPQQNTVQSTFMGVTVDLQHASTDVNWNNGVFSSPGSVKGDLIVTGTSGTLDIAGCTFNGLRAITLTSKATLTGCKIISTGLVTQSSATIDNCEFTNLTNASGFLSNNPGLISGCAFVSDGTGHAIEISTAGTYDFTDNTFTGYGADATTDAAVYNNSGGAVTLNVIGGTSPTVRNGSGASTTLVVNPVTTTITVRNIQTNAVISGARVLVTASDNTGPMPFEETVTISRSGSTATVAHTGHGLVDGKKVLIKGANEAEYNGVHTLTYIDANSYSFTVTGTPATPATGTVKSTGVVIDGTTNASGIISDTRSHGSDQPITGRVRKATGGDLYKTGIISGTISSTAGFSSTILLIADQ